MSQWTSLVGNGEVNPVPEPEIWESMHQFSLWKGGQPCWMPFLATADRCLRLGLTFGIPQRQLNSPAGDAMSVAARQGSAKLHPLALPDWHRVLRNFLAPSSSGSQQRAASIPALQRQTGMSTNDNQANILQPVKDPDPFSASSSSSLGRSSPPPRSQLPPSYSPSS